MLNAATPHLVVGDDRPLRQMPIMLHAHEPDIVIADLGGRAEELEQLLPAFLPAADQPKLLLLCDLPDGDARLVPAAELAAGIVTSHGDAMDVLDAVGRIVGGLPAASPDRFRAEAALAERQVPARAAAHITPREQQIMELIRQGCCNKRIARALEISVTTVRTHRQKLMAKLGLHNAVEIARYAAGGALGLGGPVFSQAHSHGD